MRRSARLRSSPTAPLAIGDDVEHLRERARPMLALYFGGMGARGKNFYNDVLRRYGFEREAGQIQDAYLGGRQEGGGGDGAR